MAVALPAIAIALTAVGTGIGVYSAVQQGKAAEDAANYNAKVAENSARAAAEQAEAEARQIRRLNVLRSGAQRAGYGKAGVDLSGSAEDVFFDTGAQGELEALSALYAGDIQSGYYQSRAIGSRFEGRQARSAATLRAAGTVIGGLGTVGSSLAEPSFRSSGNAGRSSGGAGYGR